MFLLNERQQNIAAIGSAILGLALSLNVGYRAFSPEQVLSPEQAASLQWQQDNNYYSNVDYGTKRYLNTLLLKAGAALGLLALAYALAETEAKQTFHPDPAMAITAHQLEREAGDLVEQHTRKAKRTTDETEETSRLSAAAALHDEVAHKVGVWCQRWPWLMGMLRAPIVLVVGQPGGGKSSVMQAIAMVRYLMFYCGVDIADLDIDKNIKKKVWVHGTAYGSEKDGSFITQIKKLTGNIKDELFPAEQGHTVLFDEVSRWVSHGHLTYDEITKLMGTAHQEWRRQNIKSVWGLHSLGVEENTGKSSCGKFTSIRDSAAILFLHPKNNAVGEPVFSGLASFKPAGEKCGVVENFLDRFTKVAIPPVFQASEIIRMLGGLTADLDIGIKDQNAAAKGQVMSWAKGQVKSTLNRAAASDDLDLEFAHVKAQLMTVDWAEVEDIGTLQSFREKTTSDRATVLPDENGVYRIRKIWLSWAKHQDWGSIADFKEYLEDLEDLGLGHSDGFTWAWNDRVEFP